MVLKTNYDYHNAALNDPNSVVNVGGYWYDTLAYPSGWPSNCYGLFLNHYWAYTRVCGDWSGSRHYPLIYHSKIYIKIIYVNSFN